MPKKANYVSTNRSKHYLKCRLIFVCKYRKKLLAGDLDNDMKAIMPSIASHSDFERKVFGSDIDHIHFLIRDIPRLSVTAIVRRLKQQSTMAIWQKHKSILSGNFWKERTFWRDGYFVCSIGEACPDTVRQYILSQG
jgi:putative transposase